MSKYSKYSKEERIIIGQKIIEENMPYSNAVRVFGVSYPTIANYVKMYRESIQCHVQEHQQITLQWNQLMVG